jgi:hypothetical protein
MASAALDLKARLDVLQRLVQDVERIAVLVLLVDGIDRAVNDALREGLLAPLHDRGNEAADDLGFVAAVRNNGALFGATTTGHLSEG